MADANGALNQAWDAANNQLTLVAVSGISTVSGGNHDANYIWSQVFDGTGIRVIRVG
jgi:hypothetical protein